MSAFSTFTPLSLLPLPSKSDLKDEFVGRKITELRTPALVIDRTKFQKNCETVTTRAKGRGLRFRAHVKSQWGHTFSERLGASLIVIAHKTTEGTRYQAKAAGGVSAFLASTMPEVWQLAMSGLVEEGLVDDVSSNARRLPMEADL